MSRYNLLLYISLKRDIRTFQVKEIELFYFQDTDRDTSVHQGEPLIGVHTPRPIPECLYKKVPWTLLLSMSFFVNFLNTVLKLKR